ncbi:MAG: tetratricopeptide repeat protein [Vicingaceae bacterium]|nr:tetratricopeptide repeat protein [Vicingaceae bacterium]
MKKHLGLIFLFLLTVQFSYSNTDSLGTFIDNSSNTGLRFEAINDLIPLAVNSEPKKAEKYARLQLQIAQVDTQIARAYLNIGLALDYQSQFDSAIIYYSKSLNLNKEIGNVFWQGQALLNLGIVTYYKGEDDASVEYYLKALKKFETLGDKSRMSAIYNNLGNLYKGRNSFLKAVEYHKKSLEIDLTRNDTLGIAGSYNNLGIDYRSLGQNDSALFYYEKSVELKKIVNDERGMANTLTNIGQVYFHQKEYDKALKYNLEALAIERKLDNKRGISQSYINIGEGYLNIGDMNSANYYLNRGYEMAKEIGVKEDVMSALEGLSGIAVKQGNYKQALEYFQNYTDYKDSLLNEETNNQIAKLDAIYENDAKRKEISLLNKEKVLQDAAIQNQQLQKVIMGVALLLVLAILFFIYRGSQQRQKASALLSAQKEIVDEKNREITDSINYAQRIQKAVLKSDEREQSNLPEHFILFKPKDIVSGDFYWMLEKEDNIYITVADCTGHGVPGGFMSMLGLAFLNEINAQKEMLSPAEILERLRIKIIKELGQKGETGESRDGMDVSMIRINKKNNKVEWAGANNPIWILSTNDELTNLSETAIQVNNSEYQFIEIKGNKQPVGFFIAPTEFTNHQFSLNKGDRFYLFSDGYADQFGGKKGKKLMKKAFKELIISNANEPIIKQGEILSNHFNQWKGSIDQIDDVCVVGVKV